MRLVVYIGPQVENGGLLCPANRILDDAGITERHCA
jgi:hypothetical protein